MSGPPSTKDEVMFGAGVGLHGHRENGQEDSVLNRHRCRTMVFTMKEQKIKIMGLVRGLGFEPKDH